MMRILVGVFLMGCVTAGAWAADPWLYIVVGHGSHGTVHQTSPWDLTYPPPGVQLPVINEGAGATQSGRWMTRTQAARVERQPQLVIANVPHLPEQPNGLLGFGVHNDWTTPKSSAGGH
ncbi:MAG: hypothetical protein ACRET1_04170 [Burkholderiales bacterium]